MVRCPDPWPKPPSRIKFLGPPKPKPVCPRSSYMTDAEFIDAHSSITTHGAYKAKGSYASLAKYEPINLLEHEIDKVRPAKFKLDLCYLANALDRTGKVLPNVFVSIILGMMSFVLVTSIVEMINITDVFACVLGICAGLITIVTAMGTFDDT